MKFHGQLSLRTPHCTLGSCVKPTGNLVECQSSLSFFLCAHKSLWAEGCCVGQQAQSFHFFSANPCVPPPASSPLLLLCFILFSCARETSVQRINIPWLVSGMLDPASGHWSPLPIFLGATAGRQLPRGTSKAPETF